MKELILQEVIEYKIFLLRGQRVMLSIHLANLYGVEIRVLIQAVKRNLERFPKDFMFQLTNKEYKNLKSQIVISSWGGIRHPPYAFTEQGIAMLSSVLRSKRAIRVNVAIMRSFVKLRGILSTHNELTYKLRELERKIEKHDVEIQDIFEAIRRLMAPQKEPKQKIGFHNI